MAPAMIVEGDVVAVHSYWTDDRSRIVTEATVQTPDGPVVVSQLGGSADGIGMVTIFLMMRRRRAARRGPPDRAAHF